MTAPTSIAAARRSSPRYLRPMPLPQKLAAVVVLVLLCAAAPSYGAHVEALLDAGDTDFDDVDFSKCFLANSVHLEPPSCDVSKELDDDLRYRTELRTAIQDCFKSSLLPPENASLMTISTGNELDQMFVRTAEQYSAASRMSDLQWQIVPPWRWRSTYPPSMTNLSSPGAPAAWLGIASSLGSHVALGAAADLSSSLPFDPVVDWTDYPIAFRSSANIYDGRVRGLLLQAIPFFMYTHGVQFGTVWEVPQTLRELAAFASKYNGTDNKWALCLPWCDSRSYFGYLYKTFIASYVQIDGTTQGFFYDPDTLAMTIVNNDAAVEVLELMRTFYKYSATKACSPVDEAFAEGRCFISLESPTLFKRTAHPNATITFKNIVKGSLTTHLLPGSSYVLDRSSGKLVRCDPERCPLARVRLADALRETAELYTAAEAAEAPLGVHVGTRTQPVPHANLSTDGRSMEQQQVTPAVNTAHFISISLAMINPEKSTNIQGNTYRYLAQVFSADNYRPYVLDPNILSFPSRRSHARVEDWIAAGYDQDDASSFLNTLGKLFDDQNPAFDIRVPGSDTLTAILHDMVMAVIADGEDAAAAMQTAADSMAAALEPYGGAEMLATEYVKSTNYKPKRPLPAPSHPPAAPGPVDAGAPRSTSGGLGTAGIVAIAVVMSAIAVLAVGIALWCAARRGLCSARMGQAGHSAAIKPPGGGSGTCLLVTDIQGSTNLWETLPALVMDLTLRLHSGCLRGLLLEHGGYESATEGDSFIIAFEDALPALRFAMAAQAALLELPWPSQLMLAAPCRELWGMPVGDSLPDSAPRYASAGGSTGTSIYPHRGGCHQRGGQPSKHDQLRTSASTDNLYHHSTHDSFWGLSNNAPDQSSSGNIANRGADTLFPSSYEGCAEPKPAAGALLASHELAAVLQKRTTGAGAADDYAPAGPPARRLLSTLPTVKAPEGIDGGAGEEDTGAVSLVPYTPRRSPVHHMASELPAVPAKDWRPYEDRPSHTAAARQGSCAALLRPALCWQMLKRRWQVRKVHRPAGVAWWAPAGDHSPGHASTSGIIVTSGQVGATGNSGLSRNSISSGSSIAKRLKRMSLSPPIAASRVGLLSKLHMQSTRDARPSPGSIQAVDEGSMHRAKTQSSIGSTHSTGAPVAFTGPLGSLWSLIDGMWEERSQVDAGAVLVARGLRVRMGLHCGVPVEAVSINKASARTTYSGACLGIAKAVADCANGAQVVLSQTAHTQLLATGKPHAAALVSLGTARSVHSAAPPMDLYLALSRTDPSAALAALALLQRPARGVEMAAAGPLELTSRMAWKLPNGLGLGTVTCFAAVVQLSVVGLRNIREWNAHTADAALGMLHAEATHQLAKVLQAERVGSLPGSAQDAGLFIGCGASAVLLENRDGEIVAVFAEGGRNLHEPQSAVSAHRWAMALHAALPDLPWPSHLLENDFCGTIMADDHVLSPFAPVPMGALLPEPPEAGPRGSSSSFHDSGAILGPPPLSRVSGTLSRILQPRSSGRPGIHASADHNTVPVRMPADSVATQSAYRLENMRRPAIARTALPEACTTAGSHAQTSGDITSAGGVSLGAESGDVVNTTSSQGEGACHSFDAPDVPRAEAQPPPTGWPGASSHHGSDNASGSPAHTVVRGTLLALPRTQPICITNTHGASRLRISSPKQRCLLEDGEAADECPVGHTSSTHQPNGLAAQHNEKSQPSSRAGAPLHPYSGMPPSGSCTASQLSGADGSSDDFYNGSPAGVATEVLPQRVLFRGLRLKAAMHVGAVELRLDPVTGHMVLGKAAAAALRKLLSKAPTGQVAR